MLSLFLFPSCTTSGKGLPSKEDVENYIIKVNDHWQSNHSRHGRAFWDNAVYHTGNIAAYNITLIDRYLKFSNDWATRNQWKGAKSNNKAEWKYNYGETDDYVLFGDWQLCFEVYIDLFELTGAKDSNKIARAVEVMNYQMGTSRTDYWWWADGLYMAMPVMSKLYQLTGNELYLKKLDTYFSYAKNIMYDKKTGLFYRDVKYIYPKHKTNNGKKDFWSRGNGWVFAGLAKTIEELPNDSEYSIQYRQLFIKMAETLKENQQDEGYWSRSLLDPLQAPGPESSGTSLFVYGLLWGINNNILPSDEYLPVALKAWNFLTSVAIDKNGRLGYVQPIGEQAIPGQIVNEHSTSNFGVGAFLLAASEMYRYLNKVGNGSTQ